MKKKDIERDNSRLFARTIIMLLELETIAEDPTSEKAKKIIAHYHKGIDIRNEREQAAKN